MLITPNFTSNFNLYFGANAAAAQAAWIAAAHVLSNHFNDNVHVNITVDAVQGSDVFAESQSSEWLSVSYNDLRALIVKDAKSADDKVAIGADGSMTTTDPTGGQAWFVTRAQAKAISLIPDDQSNDGITTFGAGNPFAFSGPIPAGTYDFQGVAAHEISEVMGRVGLSGDGGYSLIDNFSYTALGTKGLKGGPGNYFSIDNGRNLLKLFNDPQQNRLDSRDWAPGTNDAFNQFSLSGVVNPVSDVDFRLMDVIGYDVASGASAKTPARRAFGVGVAARHVQK
jgi:hypothetical protein